MVCARASFAAEEPEEPLRLDGAATAGVMTLYRAPLRDPAQELDVEPMLHARVDLERESGPFRIIGRASVLVSYPGTLLPVDLGSFVDASVRLPEDVRLSVRLVPFAQNVFRVAFDVANHFGEPPGPFRPASFTPSMNFTAAGRWWHASLGGALGTVQGSGIIISPPASVRSPWMIAAFGVQHEGLSSDLRVGVFSVEQSINDAANNPPLTRTATALRFAWARGAAGRPIDFVVYGNDPSRFTDQFSALPAVGFGFESELELGAAEPLDARPVGLALYAQLRLAAMLLEQRVFVTLRLRTPSQILWSSPFAVLNFDSVDPALIAQVGFDRRFGPVVLGLATRIAQPAVVHFFGNPTPGANPPPGLSGVREAWVSGVDGLTQYSSERGAPPRVGLKATLRLDVGAHLTVLGEVDTDFLRAPSGPIGQLQERDLTTVTAHLFAQLH
ncbi:MAG: hypothetical protein QM817_35230 [Archangium sp.]